MHYVVAVETHGLLFLISKDGFFGIKTMKIKKVILVVVAVLAFAEVKADCEIYSIGNDLHFSSECKRIIFDSPEATIFPHYNAQTGIVDGKLNINATRVDADFVVFKDPQGPQYHTKGTKGEDTIVPFISK